jgi:ATP-dependent Clp protease ATP-binding subunit ClpC
LTSNLGQVDGAGGGNLGFSEPSEEGDYAQLKKRMLEAAKRAFKPEFMNRFDDIIVFRELTREDVVEILDLELNKVRQRLKAKGRRIQVNKSAKELLIEKGFNRRMGARPLRRVVSTYLEDPLAEEILRSGFHGDGPIDVRGVGGSLKFRQRELAKNTD